MLNIYLPFNDADLVIGANHFRPEDGSGTNIFIHGTSSASLAGIGANDPLFVMAHARLSTGTEIAGDVKGRLWGTRTVTMTAPGLASALTGDNLSKRVGDLRLLVCWGGYVGGDEGALKRKQGDAPFAGQLCSALKGRGYYRMIVTGYRGSVGYSRVHPLTNVMVIGRDLQSMGTEPFTRPFNDGVAHTKMVGDRLTTRLTMDTESRTVWY